MTVTDDEIIKLLREQGDPAYSTSEVADMVGMTTDGVRNRLEDLEADGRLCRKNSSRQCTMWWLPKYDEISDYPRSAHTPPE
jgi:predicted transcriptional regulator